MTKIVTKTIARKLGIVSAFKQPGVNLQKRMGIESRWHGKSGHRAITKFNSEK